MKEIINITVIDREDVKHELEAPTDMAMNVMEACKAYELPVQGTCGGMALMRILPLLCLDGPRASGT